MIHTCIDVDVWCKWHETPLTYRIFVDNQLLTERDFIWETERHYIQEHIEVLIDPTIIHELKVERCGGGPGEIIIANVKINGEIHMDHGKTTATFALAT